MTRQNPKSSSRKILSLRRCRKLCFDVLEDRRLLAGIDVFVFDDLDGSRSFNANKDGALSNRAVYVDLNNDGKLGSSEPWTTSDSNGIASFPNLEPGAYAVRLLGNNKSIVQTFPTHPADLGSWSDGLNISKVLRVEASGLIWGISGNALTLVNVSSNQIVKSINFGASIIVDAVLQGSSNDGDVTGYVLAKNQDQSQVLWRVSTAGNGAKQTTNLDVASAAHLVTVGDRMLVLTGSSLKEISVSDSLNASPEAVLKQIGVEELPPNSAVKAVGSNSFLVFENGATTNRFSLYQLRDGAAQLVGKRSFASKVIAWEASRDGANIAIETSDDFMILRPESGLPTKAILKDAVGPIGFDPIRDLLITGKSSSPSQLSGWSIADWTESLSLPIANGRFLTRSNSSIYLDVAGTHLVGSQNGALYQHTMAVAAAALANVAGNESTRLQIGVRKTGFNRNPELKTFDPIYVDEDGQVKLDPAVISSNASDPDGDALVYVIRTSPSDGMIQWNQDASGIYTPAPDSNGKDFVTIQAYDGRDWSSPQVLTIVINPINDSPTGIASSVDSVSENPAYREPLATLRALDPDADSDYAYQVNDPRFSVLGGVLRLVNGSINFEKEPLIVLVVTAIDRLHPQDSVSQSITLGVRDVNEAPTGILLPVNLTVPELTEGLVLGRVSAIDQDANELYSWTVSDSRFEVVNGILQLANGKTLDFEEDASVAMVVRGRDSLGQFEIEQTLTITVTDQDDEPTRLVLTESATIQENQTGQKIGSVSVLDPDVGEVYSFSVSDNRFEEVRGTIQLRSGSSVSFIEPGYFDLSVTATSQRSGTQLTGKLRLNIERDRTPHHNDINPYDVDGDGVLTPLDPLILINHINNNGTGPIEQPGEGEGRLPDLDVDGDGKVTPLDILILINKLNEQAEAEGQGPEDFAVESDLLKVVVDGVQSGEGELVLSSRNQSSQVGSNSQLANNLNDASLASYLSDLSDDFGPRRLRRR